MFVVFDADMREFIDCACRILPDLLVDRWQQIHAEKVSFGYSREHTAAA